MIAVSIGNIAQNLACQLIQRQIGHIQTMGIAIGIGIIDANTLIWIIGVIFKSNGRAACNFRKDTVAHVENNLACGWSSIHTGIRNCQGINDFAGVSGLDRDGGSVGRIRTARVLMLLVIFKNRFGRSNGKFVFQCCPRNWRVRVRDGNVVCGINFRRIAGSGSFGLETVMLNSHCLDSDCGVTVFGNVIACTQGGLKRQVNLAIICLQIVIGNLNDKIICIVCISDAIWAFYLVENLIGGILIQDCKVAA